MIEMEKLNTDFVGATIRIYVDGEENLIYSPDIESISIRTGSYDGNAVGVGSVYETQCTVTLSKEFPVSIGDSIEVFFESGEDDYDDFGIYYVNALPTYSGESMTINASGQIYKNGSNYYDYSPLYTAKKRDENGELVDVNVTIEEAMQILKTRYGLEVQYEKDSDFARWIIEAPYKEYNKEDERFEWLKKGMITVKEFLSGIAVMYGGNIIERNRKIYLVPKNGDGTGGNFSAGDCDSGYDYSRVSYEIKSITLSSLPAKIDYWIVHDEGDLDEPGPVVVDLGFYTYYGTDRTQKNIFTSQIETGANFKYNQTVECDWVGYTMSHPDGSFRKDNLVYHTGRFSFVGYNEKLHAGNVINIYLDSEEYIPFVIGEMTLTWDGGFTTEISCNCNADTATGEYKSSTSSASASYQTLSYATNYFNGDAFAKKEDLKSHVENKQVHVNVEELENSALSYMVGTSGTPSGPFSVVLAGMKNKTSGAYSVAEGISTKTEGAGSHSEGNGTISKGNFSHSEGDGTISSGYASHSEGGEGTEASGMWSHAEGMGATALKDASHAEGSGTTASGQSSHSEGSGTTASGGSSHAEGSGTTASGYCSRAAGYGTKSTKSYAFAEGYMTEANGTGSHSEGYYTVASEEYSHAEGYLSNSSGKYSHSEGRSEAKGPYSHAEGYRNIAKSQGDHAEGYMTEADGYGAHAEGRETRASLTAHAEGIQTSASAHGSHAEGRETNTFGENSHVEGYGTYAASEAENSHAEGEGTRACSKNQHVQGKYNEDDAEEKYAHIVGGGASSADRKNIHTVDWNGNAWYEGDVTTGSGTSLNAIGTPESVDIDFSDYFA